MALCSLLVETIQCYRLGLPSTSGKDLSNLSKYNPPSEYDVPSNERKNGSEIFRIFFAENAAFFPDIDGVQFFGGVRNGLLHQAQTKNGWLINTGRSKLCVRQNGITVIDRDRFAEALRDVFDGYLADLKKGTWMDDIWKMAARKVWWLIRLS
jgi:hypothetical protein